MRRSQKRGARTIVAATLGAVPGAILVGSTAFIVGERALTLGVAGAVLGIAGPKRRAAESRARDLLDLLGLTDRAKDAPGVLSGGQRQRLSIARALANEPTVLLADEPTGALDSAGGAEVLELFKRLHAEGQTIMLVTHDQTVASAADRIVRMRDGSLEGVDEPMEAAPA